MEEQRISFETYNLAEKTGYPFKYVEVDGKSVPLNIPTQSLLQKWLREIFDVHVVVVPFAPTRHLWEVQVYYKLSTEYEDSIFTEQGTYEDVFEKGLQEALTLIKSVNLAEKTVLPSGK